jgi:hypothetical protein
VVSWEQVHSPGGARPHGHVPAGVDQAAQILDSHCCRNEAAQPEAQPSRTQAESSRQQGSQGVRPQPGGRSRPQGVMSVERHAAGSRAAAMSFGSSTTDNVSATYLTDSAAWSLAECPLRPETKAKQQQTARSPRHDSRPSASRLHSRMQIRRVGEGQRD